MTLFSNTIAFVVMLFFLIGCSNNSGLIYEVANLKQYPCSGKPVDVESHVMKYISLNDDKQKVIEILQREGLEVHKVINTERYTSKVQMEQSDEVYFALYDYKLSNIFLWEYYDWSLSTVFIPQFSLFITIGFKNSKLYAITAEYIANY